jgi:hypothetical protein
MRRVERAGRRYTADAIGRVRGRVAGPFGRDRHPGLVVHCCHHKVGTVWFEQVLRSVSRHFGLAYEHLDGAPSPRTRIALQHHTRVDLGTFRPFVGSHMVRDPRDVVVSGYHYHLWTDEPAIVAPDPAYGGVSYRDHLRGLDREAGLLAEIRRASNRTIAEMAVWDFADPRFLEIRYEDAMADEGSTFARLFRHYGFTERATAVAVDIARRHGFERVESRPLGTVREGRHRRSGRPGQWRDEFGPAHRELFKELTGDALVRLGYEQDDRW